MGKSTRYSDPTLRKISSEILRLKKVSNVKGEEFLVRTKPKLDMRILLAKMIINTMQWHDPRLNRKIPPQKELELTEMIVNAIPDSIRWAKPNIQKETLVNLDRGNVSKLTEDEIEAINIEERRKVGLISLSKP